MIFKQLWSIYAQFGERTLPMVYFLMTGQTQSCYEHTLTRFKMELDEELDEFYRDFPAKKRQADSHKNLKKSLGTPSPAYPYYKDLLVDFEVA